jgi:hypothetical protein
MNAIDNITLSWKFKIKYIKHKKSKIRIEDEEIDVNITSNDAIKKK